MENRFGPRKKSPYLLQHAHNPVAWQPWGQEALDLAKSQDKPIFLSIGYAHLPLVAMSWPMSPLRDAEVAELLNREYVPIKVDREERPRSGRSVYDCVPDPHRPGGLAAERMAHPGRQAFFTRGTYFPKK